MTDTGAELGARLTEAREHAGLSMRRLSAECGVSVPQIFRLEAGRGKAVKLETVQALATALNVTPSWLAFGEPCAAPSWVKIRSHRKTK